MIHIGFAKQAGYQRALRLEASLRRSRAMLRSPAAHGATLGQVDRAAKGLKAKVMARDRAGLKHMRRVARITQDPHGSYKGWLASGANTQRVRKGQHRKARAQMDHAARVGSGAPSEKLREYRRKNPPLASAFGLRKQAARGGVVLDFDGVINPYTKGWQGVDNIPEAPDPEAVRRINAWRAKRVPVVIASSRANSAKGKKAIADYLKRHGLPALKIFPKPHGELYVDDKGYKHRSWKATAAAVSRARG